MLVARASGLAVLAGHQAESGRGSRPGVAATSQGGAAFASADGVVARRRKQRLQRKDSVPLVQWRREVVVRLAEVGAGWR
jgi:hypothetical protein